MLIKLKNKNNHFIKRVDIFISKYFSSTKDGWKIDLKIAILAFLVSLFIAFPSLWIYLRPDKGGRLFYQMVQSENPLNRDLPLNAQILSYRFIVPTLNYFLGFRGYGVVTIPIVASFLNLFLISRIIRSRTENIIFTLICVIGISLTWFIAEGTAFWGTTDSVSHLLLLLPGAFNIHPTYFILALPSSLFIDERSIFACLFLWLFLIKKDLTNINSLRENKINLILLNVNRKFLFTTLSMVTGVIIWFFGRYIINSGLIAPPPDISIVTSQIPNFKEFFSRYWISQILNYLSSFKWFYFYSFFLIIQLSKKSSNYINKKFGFNCKRYYGIHCLVFVFYSALVMINGDVWRSMAFAYFFILESIIILYTLNKELSLSINYWITFLMLITPVSFFGLNLTPQISFPLPLVLLRTYFGLGDSFMLFFKSLFEYVPS